MSFGLFCSSSHLISSELSFSEGLEKGRKKLSPLLSLALLLIDIKSKIYELEGQWKPVKQRVIYLNRRKMPLLSGYSSSEDEALHHETSAFQAPKVNAAPETRGTSVSKELTIPTNQDNKTNQIEKIIAGHIQREAFDDSTFEIQHRNFEQLGYAKGIHGSNAIVGNQDTANRLNKRDISEVWPSKDEKRRVKAKRAAKGKFGTAESEHSYTGPWTKYHGSSSDEEDVDSEKQSSESEEEDDGTNQQFEEVAEEEPETTEFFGQSETDYQGRTYMHIPTDVGINLKSDTEPEECFVPKRQIHVWKGHVNGTNKIIFFPKSNHLLLSCGNDSKIHLWETYHKRELLRGFYGHTKPIKDIAFNNDGTKFLSASYDHWVKLWDTETGACLARFRLKSVANVIKFNPFNDDEFIVGLMNGKIHHYSISSNQVIQTYDHHLGSINSITFLRTKRFISTSEDKTVRIWDLQINIPVKLISDPSLHSMPVTRVHPENKYFAAQSMDNTIMVFSARERYKTNKKKLFTGHNCAGYGIGIDFSPDGKYLVSGDSNGNVICWDWKTTKIIKKLKIDEKAITQVLWNTKEVSKVAFTGTSGKIYYYE